MNFNIKRMLAASARAVLAFVLLACGAQAVEAQDNTKSFSVCALNVDGLPNEIIGIKINPDGKGAEGATAIGTYLRASGVDIMALSEDFNYHDNLVNALGGGYNIGTYRGGISSENYKADVSFDTDGLEFIVKSPLKFEEEQWTAWKQTYGKFENGSDELINKGYRFYTVDFGDGVVVDIYTMHMDADTDPQDNAARASQWEQLRDAILANPNGHAVIVMGDTNSRYTRDDILSLFIDPINAAGKYTVTDAWIDLCKNGEYPKLDNSETLVIPADKKTDPEAYRYYEIVDKVLFLNPVNPANSTTLTANSITFDAARYQSADGELLGDHVPVIVNFTATYHSDPSTLNACSSDKWWNGEQIEGNGQEVYIYNVGKKYFISHDTKPKVTDVNAAPTWFVRSQTKGYTFDSDKYRLHMEYKGSWNTKIQENSGATTFTALLNDDAQNMEGEYVYKLVNTRNKLLGGTETRYFNIDTDGNSPKYSAAESKGSANDWLLISPKQKQTYDKYVELFDEAKSYLGKEGLTEELRTDLDNTLEQTSQSYYLRSDEDIKALNDIIEKINKTATGLTIATETKDAHITDIYGVDGKRRATMCRGINIVRMSNGKVKKVVK